MDDTRGKLRRFINICNYYLHCLILDDSSGINASCGQTPPHYQSLDSLEGLGQSKFLDSPAVHAMRGVVRSEKTKLALFVGYPVFVGQQASRGNAPARTTIEPVMLYPIELPDTEEGMPQIDWSHPVINPAVLKRFTSEGNSDALLYLNELEKNLGIDEANHGHTIVELGARLQQVRPEWPWMVLPQDVLRPEIGSATPEGIYSQPVVIAGKTSPFTQGLEWELKYLIKQAGKGIQENRDILAGTALDYFINPRTISKQVAPTLFDPIGLNIEQRAAVASAHSQPVTVVTGPPGTGKSFFSTGLIIDHAYKGESVLFATKNNPAIDVVLRKLNSTTEQNIAVRTGSGEHQLALATYLYDVFTESASANDEEKLRSLQEQYDSMSSQVEYYTGAQAKLAKVHAELISHDELVQKSKESLTPAQYQVLSGNSSQVSVAASKLNKSYDETIKANHGFFTRLFWFFKRSHFLQELSVYYDRCQKLHEGVFYCQDSTPTCKTVQLWVDYAQHERNIATWFDLKKQFEAMPSSEEITRSQLILQNHLVSIAAELWRLWNKCRTLRLEQKDRTNLSKGSVLLKMIASQQGGTRIGQDLYRQFMDHARNLSQIVPIWATTTLSAKCRVPFRAGFFSVVVLDEMGQSDIASCLPLLFRAKRAVVIGDPKQLAHISQISQAHDPMLLKQHDLLANDAQFSYGANSLFDLAASCVTHEQIIHFRDHHRSHRDIIEFSNRHFYNHNLFVATESSNLRPLSSTDKAIEWIDGEFRATRPQYDSLQNHGEAQAVVEKLRQEVFTNGYAGSIGVVSPFRAQVNLIKRLVSKDAELEQALGQRSCQIDTVHKYQGDERDWVVFSSVISSGIPKGAHRFLAANGNLFNVAITRARASLSVFGNVQALQQYPVEYLQAFYDYVQALSTGPATPKIMDSDKSSEWEKRFYVALAETGIKVQPQWSVDHYELDFALFDGKRKLDLEVDGAAYHRNAQGGLCRQDQDRNYRLMSLGWDVQRFWVYQLRDDMDGCVSRVKSWLEAK